MTQVGVKTSLEKHELKDAVGRRLHRVALQLTTRRLSGGCGMELCIYVYYLWTRIVKFEMGQNY